MSLVRLDLRLEEIESKIESLFRDQFRGMEDDSTAYVVQSPSQKDMHTVGTWLEIVDSEFLSSVLQTIAHVMLTRESSALLILPATAPMANRVKSALLSLQEAVHTWDQICTARHEAYFSPGGLNKEELWRYRASMEVAKEKLLGRIASARICIEEVNDAMERTRSIHGTFSRPPIRCPITGQSCEKEIVPRPERVFVGYQFHSEYYRNASFKAMVSEALLQYNLTPFFPDEHYEPVHISCEVCHALQEGEICVFEISDSNPNVAFELGLAYMLGKLTVLLAKKASPGTHISDIAGIHRIEYEDLVECRNSIVRYLGDSAMVQGLLERRARE